MRYFDLAIFDCDGVLLDSKEANRAYYNDILANSGRGPMSEDETQYVHTHTAEQSIFYLFRNNKALHEKAVFFAKHLNYSNYFYLLRMEPGVVETIRAVRPPVLTAIFTNRTTTMPKLREMFGFDSLFDSILCALDVAHPKPDPEGILRVIDLLGVDRERVIYVGDSVLDEQAAMNAKIPFVAYKNRSLEAMFHVKHFNEIAHILLSEKAVMK
jgi:HAD superfamily hydrolase (TIGR01509 family)